jgi:hypothetical protein
MMMMNDADHKALTMAMQRARLQGRDQQLEAMLQHEPWEQVARFAASCCQIVTLQLKPWESPPCAINDPEHPSVNERAAAKLLRKMLRHGVSRWHPDPCAAIAAVEVRR